MPAERYTLLDGRVHVYRRANSRFWQCAIYLICLRLMEGADIYQVAKNCRTSVDMIEKFYASHIKTRLDTAAINVTKTPTRKAPSGPLVAGERPCDDLANASLADR